MKDGVGVKSARRIEGALGPTKGRESSSPPFLGRPTNDERFNPSQAPASQQGAPTLPRHLTYRALKNASRKRKAVPRSGFNSTLPKSKSRPKKVNASRKAKEFARCYGSQERVTWVKQQPCIVCRGSWGPAENVHIETDGMGRKAGFARIVPLCRRGHQQLHEYGRETFAAIFHKDLDALAAETEQKWRAHLARLAPVTAAVENVGHPTRNRNWK